MSDRSRKTLLAAVVIPAGFAAYIGLLFWPQPLELSQLPVALGLIVAMVLISMVEISVGTDVAISPEIAPVALALYAGGPGLASVVLAISSTITAIQRRRAPLRVVYTSAQFGLSLLAFSLIYLALAGKQAGPVLLSRVLDGDLLLGLRLTGSAVLGTLAYVLVNDLLVGRYVILEQHLESFAWGQLLWADAIGCVIFSVMGGLLSLLVTQLGWLLAALYSVPAAGVLWAVFRLMHARLDGEMSVSHRLATILTAGAGVVFLVLSAAVLTSFHRHYTRALLQGSQQVAEMTVAAAGGGGAAQLDALAERLAAGDADLAYAVVTDGAGGAVDRLHVAERWRGAEDAVRTVLRGTGDGTRVAYLDDGRVLRVRQVSAVLPAGAELRLGVDLGAAQDLERGLGLTLGAATLLLFGLLMAGLRYYTQTQLIAPLSAAGDALRRIADGEADLRQRLPEAGDREIAELSRQFNRFIAGLAELVGAAAETARVVSQGAQDVASSTEQLSASAGAVSGSVEEAAHWMEKQATQAAELHGLTSELDSLSQEAARRTADARSEADAIVASVERSREGIARTGGVLLEVREAVRAADDAGSELIRASGEIADLVHTIRDIASQTNLLALNAAIEAARAGDQGRGFAVVADEVRKLADQSATAAAAAGQLVDQIAQRADRLAAAMRQGGDRVQGVEQTAAASNQALDVIVSSVQRIGAAVGQVADGITRERSIVEKVDGQVAEIERLLRDSAALVTEVLAAAQEQTGSTEHMADLAVSLADRADRLDELVARFRVDAASPDRPAAAPRELVAAD